MFSYKYLRRLIIQAGCAAILFAAVLLLLRLQQSIGTRAYRPARTENGDPRFSGFNDGFRTEIPRSRTLPDAVGDALAVRNQTGYLLGNKNKLTFVPYEKDVDLRIVILTLNRPDSLKETLEAILEVDFLGDKVSVEIWIDRDKNNNVDFKTLKIAKHFIAIYKTFDYHVHIQNEHVGVQGQWMNVWRPSYTKEICLILEDDITVSVHFWKWLKAVHQHYDTLPFISGYSLSHPKISHQRGIGLDLSRFVVNYAYKVICTTGYSPHIKSWRQYQDWYYLVEQDPTFTPYVQDILPSQWFVSEKAKGKERNLWDMWHIYFTNQHKQFTVMLNTLKSGLLAVNRHEAGLHDSASNVGPQEPLCTKWSDSYVDFPSDLPFIDYDGMPI